MSEPGGFSDADIRVGDGVAAGRCSMAIETTAGDASGTFLTSFCAPTMVKSVECRYQSVSCAA